MSAVTPVTRSTLQPGAATLVRGEFIRIYKRKIVGALTFQFNPTTITETLGVEWYFTESPGQYMPTASFKRMGEHKLSIELMFYGRERGQPASYYGMFDGSQDIHRLKSFMQPGPGMTKTVPRFASPGQYKFVFGPNVWQVVLTQVEFNHTTFARDGRIVVATAKVEMRVISTGLDSDIAERDRILRIARQES